MQKLIIILTIRSVHVQLDFHKKVFLGQKITDRYASTNIAIFAIRKYLILCAKYELCPGGGNEKVEGKDAKVLIFMNILLL